MANNGRITRSSNPRALQLGLDKIIDQMGKDYQGKGDKIFEEIKTDKAFFEIMQQAGMGIAARKGEGEAIDFDSIDQSWVFRVPVYTYQKSSRITREGLRDNKYEALLPKMAKQQLRGLAHARDINQATVLNNAFNSAYTFGDTAQLCSTSHQTQSGATNSNRLAVDADLSEESLEASVLVADAFILDEGLQSEYTTKRLIIPNPLRFESKRILKNPMRPGTANRDINVLNMEDDISEIVAWKRLSSASAFFVQTDAEEGLILVRREGVFTMEGKDFDTYDSKLTAAESYAVSVGDHRTVVGSNGP